MSASERSDTPTPAKARTIPTLTRALCPLLIGRLEELARLEDALLAALRGEGHVIVVTGDAGVGKTRLASELSRRAGKIGCAVMTGSCSEAELALPYLPFLEAIGSYIAGSDVDQLKVRLGRSCREVGLLFPRLGESVSSSEGDPAQARLRLFEAVVDLLRIPAEDHGLLLVIEDLQWADRSSCEVLDYLTRRLDNTRIVVLATYRREELHRQHPLLPTIQGWRRSGLATVVDLEPLPAEGVAGMMQAIFDEEQVTDEFRDFMHARTEGNPFVLEEMLKAALDRQDIFFSPEKGIWDRKALQELAIPPTVRDTILLRVERLTPMEAEVLRAAAVLGRSFDYSLLMMICGREQSVVEAALQAATQQQLIEEDPGSAGRYRFRHALTQEAVYQDLSAPYRERLHRTAAEALRGKTGTAAADLAHHLMAANHWEEATPVCLQAADEAKHHLGYREAAAMYARLVSHLPDPATQGRVRCLLGEAQFSAGDYGKALPSLEDGIRALEQQDQRREAAHYRLSLGRCHWEQSHPALARAEFELVRTTLESEEPSEDLAFAYVNLARLHMMQAEFREMLPLVDRAISVAVAAGADAPRIWAYNYRGSALSHLGRTAEGLVDLDRSYREAVEGGLDWIAATALNNGIVVHLNCFRVQKALKGVELYRALGGLAVMWAGGAECVIRRLLGEPATARSVGEEALAMALRAEASTLVARIRQELAFSYCALGSFEEAHRLLASEGRELERQDAGWLAEAKLRVYLDEGDLENAVPQAQFVLADLQQRSEPDPFGLDLVDKAVEVFVKAGMLIEAIQLLERARTAPTQADNPYLARMEGLVASAQGDLTRARACLQAASDFLAQASYRDDEWGTRRALAEVKTQMGDRAGAVSELRAVLTEAEKQGHVTQAEAARKQLRELGVEVAPAVSASPVSDRDLRRVEERFVTVMFADVRGYTALSGQMAPPDLADRIGAFYRWSEQEIARHHGLVTQYGGDAVMATFNVSGVRLDHCLHALQAAIAIRDKAAYAGLPVGVGISVGAAVVGQLSPGSPVTAVGETTNLAARLQGQARAGEIVLSQDAYRRVRDWLDSQHLEARQARLSLKGIGKAVHAFVLPSRTPASTAV